MDEVLIRPATADDAAEVARVLNGVVAERRYSAQDMPVTPESEARWISSFGPRAAMFVAEVEGRIQAYQTLEPYCAFVRSMDHVGVAGTQVARPLRRRGLGRRLWAHTSSFAREHAYEKVVVQVRAGNADALAFYRGLGFAEFGVSRRHVRIDGAYEDEVFLECFLEGAAPGGPGRDSGGRKG